MKKIKVLPKHASASPLLTIQTDASTEPPINFTPREVDILACLAFRNTNQEISALLNINTRGVESHIRNIREKLNNIPRLAIQKLLEKCDQAEAIRPHYTNIQTEALFQQKLEAFKKECNQSRLHISCNYENFNGNGIEFKKIFQEHLENCGCEISEDSSSSSIKLTLSAKESACANDTPQDHPLTSIDARIDYPVGENKPNASKHFVIELEQRYYNSFFLLLENLTSSSKLKKIKKSFDTESSNLQQSSFPDVFTASAASSKKGFRIKTPSIRKILGTQIVLALCILLPFAGFWLYKKSAQETELKSVRSDLLVPIKSSYLARPGLMNQISKHFEAQREDHATTVVSIVGIGGSGKTTLARMFCNEQESVPVIWEINAETSERAFSSFKDLAYALAQTQEAREELGYIMNIEKPQALAKQLMRFVKEKLHKQNDWILIYDNVVSMREIRAWFPNEKSQWGNGKIIITTRNHHVCETSYIKPDSVIHLSVLNTDEQLELLSKIIYQRKVSQLSSTERKKAQIFLQALPPFPLDIALAAYSLKNTDISFPQYLTQLKGHSDTFENLQESVLTESTDYSKTRHGIISLTVKDIGSLHPDYKELFLLLSLVDSQLIPIDLFKLNKNIVIANDFIYQLGRHGLLLKQAHHKDFRHKDTISIHRSAQEIGSAFLLKELSDREKSDMMKNIIQTFSDLYTNCHKRKKTRKIVALIPHLTSLYENIEATTLPLKTKKECQLALLRMLGNAHQRYAHNQLKAYNYFKEAHTINKKWRFLTRMREARLLSDMATIATIINDDTQALEYCNESLRICGNEKDFIITKTQVLQLRGTLYRKAGAFDEGLEHYKKALKNIGSLDTENTRRLRAEINSQIAFLYTTHFLYKKEGHEAEKHAYEALKILGATKKFNVGKQEIPAYLSWEAGRYRWKYAQVFIYHFADFNRAYEELKEALYIIEKTRPNNMFTKGRIYGTTGVALLRLKKYKEAEIVLTDSINLIGIVLGKQSAWPQHAYRAEARIKLGKLQEAYEDCLAVQNQTIVEKNNLLLLSYWTAAYHAGVIQYRQNNHEKALQHLKDFHNSIKYFCQSFFNSKELDHLKKMDAWSHPDLDKVSTKEAIRHYLHRCYIILETIHGPNHPFISEHVRPNTSL